MIWSVEHATWHCYPTKKSLADLLLLSELRFVQRLLRYAIIGDCTFAFLLFCPLAVLLFCLSRWSVYWNMQLDTSILLIKALRIECCCQNRDCSSGCWETKILATCTVMNNSGQICCLTDDPTMYNPLKLAKWHFYPTNMDLADRLLLSELRFLQWLLRNANIGTFLRQFLSRVASTPLKTMKKCAISLAIHRAPS